jgi:glycerophosphoryl diester phosphodiesterase
LPHRGKPAGIETGTLTGMEIRPGGPLILGHRGYRARCPENTLLAFREAAAHGADGIECDLQKAADGRYLVIHDPVTDRVSTEHLFVHESTLQELQRLDVGSGERIPTLEEMLDALPGGAYLDLELKEETLTPADAEGVAAVLDAHRSRERLMISSFDPGLLFAFRRMGFTVGYLVGDETARRGLRGFAKVLLELRPQFINLPVDMIAIFGRRKAALVFRVLRAFGFALLFWTVNTVEEAAILAPYAGILVTDEVERIIDAGRR